MKTNGVQGRVAESFRYDLVSEFRAGCTLHTMAKTIDVMGRNDSMGGVMLAGSLLLYGMGRFSHQALTALYGIRSELRELRRARSE